MDKISRSVSRIVLIKRNPFSLCIGMDTGIIVISVAGYGDQFGSLIIKIRGPPE